MSRGRDELDVVVVGAGLVGACLALGLARDGRRVAVVEAAQPAPWRADTEGLRVVALAADAVEQLTGLGVWSDVVSRRAHPYRRMRVWDAGAAGELDFDADRFGQPQLGWIVELDLLADRLWRAIAAEPGLRRACPARVETLGQDGHHAWVGLDDGQQLRARLVVAADGVHSRTRELAGINAREHDYGQRGLVATVATSRSHEDTAWQRFLPGGPLAFLPLSDGRSSIVWSLPDAEAQRLLDADETRFLDELTRALDGRLGQVTDVSKRVAFPLRRQLADAYVAGRVVLAGDSAHAVHPLAGQGVNLGLRDVVALRAQVAAAGTRDFASPHRLARYQRARRSDNVASAWAFDRINRWFSNDALLPVLLRGPMLAAANAVPGLARLLWMHAAGR